MGCIIEKTKILQFYNYSLQKNNYICKIIKIGII